MSEYSHNAGLTISLIIGGITGFGYLLIASSRFEMPKAARLLRPTTADIVNNPFPLVMVVSGATFCLLFAVLNPLLQLDRLNLAELRGQLADGTLVLRLSTVAFVLPVLWQAAAHLVRRDLSDRDRRVRDFTQSGIFVAALFALWILSTRNAHGIPTAFLNLRVRLLLR
jgi:hypothetical protein